jgi:hypothetical protein
MIVQTCIPSYVGGGDRWTRVQGQPGQKVSKTLYQKNKSGMVIHQLLSQSTQEAEVEGITVWGWLEQKHKTLSEKKNYSKNGSKGKMSAWGHVLKKIKKEKE